MPCEAQIDVKTQLEKNLNLRIKKGCIYIIAVKLDFLTHVISEMVTRNFVNRK